jgi:glucose-1-phosphate thymidylyltransferase
VEATEKMKGVILAGGKGTRMLPLTKVTNKHLLPIYDAPMIYYPIRTLVAAGIKDILIVVGGESMGDFLRLLGDGSEFGITLTYRCQVGSGGIPSALSLAKEFADGENVMVVLGDNIMEESVAKDVVEFELRKKPAGAKLFLKEVHDPQRYGVIELKDGKIVAIHEKPKNPPTNLCATGVYLFDSEIFDIIARLHPSKRGELEIADAVSDYMTKGRLSWGKINDYWTDAGTLESWFEANQMVREKRQKKA